MLSQRGSRNAQPRFAGSQRILRTGLAARLHALEKRGRRDQSVEDHMVRNMTGFAQCSVNCDGFNIASIGPIARGGNNPLRAQPQSG